MEADDPLWRPLTGIFEGRVRYAYMLQFVLGSEAASTITLSWRMSFEGKADVDRYDTFFPVSLLNVL